jgi:hypothetical protein
MNRGRKAKGTLFPPNGLLRLAGGSKIAGLTNTADKNTIRNGGDNE